ncbi:HPr family phosphocarrier protein [Alicyclobacillaceae bacterium I2511]|nr:HPr family phosphocarrier protein [Alicyclobacillaceae bacterium I2511]
MQERRVTIHNPSGLHARPAALLVQTAGKFVSEVQIEKEGKSVDAKSVLGVMSLAIAQGTGVIIRANGADEAEAVTAIAEIIEQGLGESN